MPYCPECGIHYLQPNPICVSCGRDLSDTSNSPDLALETFGKTASPDPPPEETIIEFNGFKPQVESHLGKGLVKPQSVEVGLDGFHFKYDQPPHKLAKSEALKDKVVEFRVTAPAEPLAPAEPSEFNPETVTPEVLPEGSWQEESALPEFEEGIPEKEPAAEAPPVECSLFEEPAEPENLVEPELMGARVDKPANPVEPETTIPPEIGPVAESEDTETLNPPAGNGEGFGVSEDDLTPEFPEPELKSLDEPETLWEGKGSWYGFGARAQYRITNQSVVIVEPGSYRFTEFELALISKVKISRNWLMKLLGVGDVSMSVRGMPEPGLMLKGIRAPEKVKRLIEELLA